MKNTPASSHLEANGERIQKADFGSSFFLFQLDTVHLKAAVSNRIPNITAWETSRPSFITLLYLEKDTNLIALLILR